MSKEEQIDIKILLKNSDETKKELDEIEAKLKLLKESEIALKAEIKLAADEKDQKKAEIQLAAVEKRVKELSKIETTVEIEEKTLTDTEKEIETLKKKLEADKLILKFKTDNENRAEVKKYIKEDISEIRSELFELQNEQFKVEVQAFLDTSNISSYLNNFETYAYGLFDSIIEHINTNKLNNLTNDYYDKIAELNERYGIEEELYDEYLYNIKCKKEEYQDSISEMEDERDQLEKEKLAA